MNCDIEWSRIGDIDNNSITFLSMNNRSGEHSVYDRNVLAVAEFSNSHGLYLKCQENFGQKPIPKGQDITGLNIIHT